MDEKGEKLLVDQAFDLVKLRRFYNAVRLLTLNHAVINDNAVVTASQLGKALEKVDPNWWKEEADVSMVKKDMARPRRRRDR